MGTIKSINGNGQMLRAGEMVSYRTFLNWHNQFSMLKKNKDGVYLMLEAKINKFYADNNVKIERIVKECEDLRVKYLVLDEGGKPVKSEDGKSWKPLDGMLYEDFVIQSEELLNKEVALIR